MPDWRRFFNAVGSAPSGVDLDNPFSGSVGVNVAAVGPFRVQHGTPGLETAAGVLLLNLPVGAFILNISVPVFEDFNGGTTVLTVGGWIGAAMDTALYQVVGPTAGDDRSNGFSAGSSATSGLPSVVRASNASLRARVDGSGLTTGDADIYAILAVPAS